jgi:tetratricopeptide (TPR) repeat protein
MRAGTNRPKGQLLLQLLSLTALVASGCASKMGDEAPSVNYIPDASYYLMMAEIALQKKQFRTAAEEYSNATQQSDDPELARRAAQFAFEYGLDTYALSSAQRWLVLDPDSESAHALVARLYLRRNDLERSLYHWRRSLGPGPEHGEDTYLDMAASLAEERNARGATIVLTQISNDAPESPALRLALAESALRSGDFALALKSARKAAESDPDSPQPHIVIAQALLAMGAEPDAMEGMEALIERSPNLPVELEYVRMLSATNRVVDASLQLRKLVQKYGGSPELVRMHALLSLIAGDLESAERDFLQLLASSSHVYESYYYLGQIASLQGNHRDAINYYKRISGGEHLVPAQIAISQTWVQIGEPETGYEHLETFIADYPHHVFDTVAARAALLHAMERDDDALDVYDDALRYKPESIDLLLAKATLLDQMERTDEAVDLMDYALTVNPMDPNVLNSLGYTLTNRTNRHEDAYRHIRLALELDPYSPAIIDSMGWVLFQLGRLEESRSYLEQAYSMLKDPEVVAHLGAVWWELGEQERARELWDLSLQTNPDSKPLLTMRAKYLP